MSGPRGVRCKHCGQKWLVINIESRQRHDPSAFHCPPAFLCLPLSVSSLLPFFFSSFLSFLPLSSHFCYTSLGLVPFKGWYQLPSPSSSHLPSVARRAASLEPTTPSNDIITTCPHATAIAMGSILPLSRAWEWIAFISWFGNKCIRQRKSNEGPGTKPLLPVNSNLSLLYILFEKTEQVHVIVLIRWKYYLFITLNSFMPLI